MQRKAEVIDYVSLGVPQRQIAKILNVSPMTINRDLKDALANETEEHRESRIKLRKGLDWLSGYAFLKMRSNTTSEDKKLKWFDRISNIMQIKANYLKNIDINIQNNQTNIQVNQLTPYEALKGLSDLWRDD